MRVSIQMKKTLKTKKAMQVLSLSSRKHYKALQAEKNRRRNGQGRHGKTIQLGRAQWETDALTAEQETRVQEVSFDDIMSPDYKKNAECQKKPRTKLQKQSSKVIQDLHHTRVQK